jgi:hypothetical protein
MAILEINSGSAFAERLRHPDNNNHAARSPAKS